MSAIFHNLRQWFANPEALWLLLALPILGLLGGWARRRRRRALALWESRSYFPPISLAQIPRRILTNAGLSVGLGLLILGIAGPQWGQELDPALVPGRDIVVLLDMSRSMLAQDVLGTSSPNRLGRARDGLLDLVNTVQQRGGHRLALVVFAARAAVVCPLTHDYNHFREALLELEPDDPFLEIGPDASALVSGTRMGAGLRLAVTLHDPQYRGYQDILMISDGDDPARDDEWREGVAAAKKEGIAVHTVGVGDPDKASPIPLGPQEKLVFQGVLVQTKLEEKILEEIANQTGGSYIPARTKALPLGRIFQEKLEHRPRREDQEEFLPVYQQHSSWFFTGSLVLLSLEMAFNDLGRRRKKIHNP